MSIPRTSPEGVLITRDNERTTSELNAGDTVYYHGAPRTIASCLVPQHGPQGFREVYFSDSSSSLYIPTAHVWTLTACALQRVPFIHATTASVARMTLFADPLSISAPSIRAAALHTVNAHLRAVSPRTPQVCVWLAALTADPGDLDYYCGQLVSYTHAPDTSCGVLKFADSTHLYDQHLVRITF